MLWEDEQSSKDGGVKGYVTERSKKFVCLIDCLISLDYEV